MTEKFLAEDLQNEFRKRFEEELEAEELEELEEREPIRAQADDLKRKLERDLRRDLERRNASRFVSTRR